MQTSHTYVGKPRCWLLLALWLVWLCWSGLRCGSCASLECGCWGAGQPACWWSLGLVSWCGWYDDPWCCHPHWRWGCSESSRQPSRQHHLLLRLLGAGLWQAGSGLLQAVKMFARSFGPSMFCFACLGGPSGGMGPSSTSAGSARARLAGGPSNHCWMCVSLPCPSCFVALRLVGVRLGALFVVVGLVVTAACAAARSLSGSPLWRGQRCQPIWH